MDNEDLGFFDPTRTPKLGIELAAKYAAAEPFPHIVIDDFLPTGILDRCLENFPNTPDPESRAFDAPTERKKTQYNPDYLAPEQRSLFYSFNSRPFIAFVENITGIDRLIPDPYFSGAGFHELKAGGHLSVHADFNRLEELDLERRVNILVYLNKNWEDSHGGQLELWADDMSRCVQSVVPRFNRAVIFTTTSTTNHGNPNPIAHPEGRSRKSIALYYYTATGSSQQSHSTLFKPRPGADAEVHEGRGRRAGRASALATDLLPPVAVRGLRRARAAARNRRA